MRTQQTTAVKVNDVLSDIRVLCTKSTFSLTISFEHQMKDTLHFKKRRTTWTMDQTGNPLTDIYVFHSFGCNRHKDEDSSVIAQPMFVFKKERSCKRPAEDPVHKTENVPSGSRKRARTSYFSFQSSDSESYRGKASLLTIRFMFNLH
ncbi:PREDICTED: ran-binding protein 3-like [Thamnophis sirtalis]|uniref:Ran-binding protein 3-like n=1 Tax=Thamnophis sirtalis TaxID=35019 RepID=A0A6I9Z7D6_9SAUR|nr:PREDICTED: ran-binding protein 3-like [Thamnophis sirtalis]